MIVRLSALALCFWLAMAASGQADVKRYALVIGHNAPPAGDTSLKPLRYADDDAARFYQMVKRWGSYSRLLAVFDEDTQTRYGNLRSEARIPNVRNLQEAVSDIAQRAEADQDKGHDVIFYLIFAGHGTVSNGEPFLVLTDGKITQDMLYDEIVASVPSRFTHVIVDACNAGGVVGSRGMFDKEVDGSTAPVSPAGMMAANESKRAPNVGVLVATALGQEAHEWSEIESGVFAHEILSGFTGAADVNRDGLIEYTEIRAFVAAANSRVQNRAARSDLIAEAPAVDHGAPLVVLPSSDGVAWLEGNAMELDHFHVELSNGERYLDANIGSPAPIRLAVPANRSFFLRTEEGEAQLKARNGQVIKLASLTLEPSSSGSRGALESSLHTGLFAAAFTEKYYSGFVDSVGERSVSFEGVALDYDLPEPKKRKPLAVTLLSVSAASLVATGVAAGIAIKAKKDFNNQSIQIEAEPARLRLKRARAIAISTGAMTVASGIAAALLWPKAEKHRFEASFDPAARAFSVGASGSF